jgi:hypothetical protein
MAGIQSLIQRFADGGQPAFSSDPTINAQWNALAGKTGADITAQRQALAQQNEAYNTNQNLNNLYGITEAPAQKQFLTDFNTAAATPGFQSVAPTGNAYAPTATQSFEQALAAANAANPGKGASNALMNQFTTGAGAADNPFLGQYNYMTQGGGPASITPFTVQQLYNQQHPTVASPAAINTVGGYFDTNRFKSTSESIDPEGYKIVTTPVGTFKVNPVNYKIVSVTPVAKASGGSVGMPDSYSQGNWKLI